ncbi:hypothetical protein AAMO2058_000917500 [Amorphochlora amoebiformis]
MVNNEHSSQYENISICQHKEYAKRLSELGPDKKTEIQSGDEQETALLRATVEMLKSQIRQVSLTLFTLCSLLLIISA